MSKSLTKLDEKTKELRDKLNLKQRRFCELYASSEEFFANGAQSYIKVFSTTRNKIGYLTATANASRLLANAKVTDYVNHLLELRGLNDTFVDKQLEFLITQHANFKSKLGAISEYNKLKRRTEGGGNKTLVLVVTGETANRYGINSNQEPSGGSIKQA